MATVRMATGGAVLHAMHGGHHHQSLLLVGLKQQLPLSFRRGQWNVVGRRSLCCKAIYRPEVHVKEEGQPSTLDYRVFFFDKSGKKGTLTAIRDWFRDYKIPDGKPANKFGLGNKAASKEYALKVIEETNESWSKLVKRSIAAGELSLVYSH